MSLELCFVQKKIKILLTIKNNKDVITVKKLYNLEKYLQT